VDWTALPDNAWKSTVLTVDPLPAGITATRKGIAMVQFDDGPKLALPVEVWSKPDMQLPELSLTKSYLPLGPESSLLDRLLNQSYIPSRFIGLFFGSRSLSNPINGELLVGGWDSSRVNGSFVNYTISAFPMSISCPLRVKVKRVVLHANETSHSILDEGQLVSACVDMMQNQLTFTDAMYSKWAEVTQHPTQPDGPEFDLQTYPLSNERLMGDLYIELEGGYSTTIPHYELVGPERGAKLDHLGEYGIVNSSRIMAAVGAGTTDYGEDFGMLLGGAFLASTYVFLDYDTNSFGLAPAILKREKNNVQTVCSKDRSIPAPAPAPSSNNSAPGMDSQSTLGGSGLSKSDKIAIGVGVPGGLAVIIALIALVISVKQFNLMKTRRKKKHELQVQELESRLSSFTPVPSAFQTAPAAADTTERNPSKVQPTPVSPRLIPSPSKE
jgi:hypothetical protein